MRVRIPRPDSPTRPSPMYLDFIQRGLEAMDVTVIRDVRTPTRPRSIMALEIVEKGERARVWWDWSDFGHCKDDSLKEPCAKIELRRGDRTPLRFAVGQVTPMACVDDLNHLRAAKATRRTLDVYCVVRETNFDARLQCVRAINSQPWKSVAYMTKRRNRPPVPADVLGLKLAQKENYRMQIQAKVCIAPPGIGEQTWRHMETLAMGLCLVCAESDRVWPGDPLGCFVTCKRDWSDLPEKVDYLLTHDQEREAIAARGQEYWTQYLSPVALAQSLIAAARKVDS